MRYRRRCAAGVGVLGAILASGCSSTSTGPSAAGSSSLAPTVDGVERLPSHDTFSGTSLHGWRLFAGDETGDPAGHVDSVATSLLTLRPTQSPWIDTTRGLFLWKTVRGDFIATMRVQVAGSATSTPAGERTLSGILVRSPASSSVGENWVSLETGVVHGRRIDERTSTVASRSTSVAIGPAAGWAQLGVARVGERLLLFRRSREGRWALAWTYRRADLPRTLQVGIDAFGGSNSSGSALVSRVDWFRLSAPDIPAHMRNVPPADLLPYLTREGR